MWIKAPHPCWKVQKALDQSGIEYEVVKHPSSRSKRTEYAELTGQKLLPAIQLEDGTVIRRQSRELVEMVKSGRLQSAPTAPSTPSSAPSSPSSAPSTPPS
jgi:Glutathione S-transferase, N-terminal domain